MEWKGNDWTTWLPKSTWFGTTEDETDPEHDKLEHKLQELRAERLPIAGKMSIDQLQSVRELSNCFIYQYDYRHALNRVQLQCEGVCFHPLLKPART
eukprot:3791424-Amphidinium_carterae.1